MWKAYLSKAKKYPFESASPYPQRYHTHRATRFGVAGGAAND